MKILLIHNNYLHHGGEDEVVKAEKRILEKHGHHVILFERSNSEFDKYHLIQKLRFGLKNIYWSGDIYREVRELIQRENPDIAHIHNTFYVLSPSVYAACSDEKVPIVQTLHNYRFLCPIGTFFREGEICQECLQKGRESVVVHRCWKNSVIASNILRKIVEEFYKKDILTKAINQFIVLSQFSSQMYIQSGFSEEKISVKSNFLDYDPGVSDGVGDYGLFAGGFSPYKGIKTLLEAWNSLDTNFPLKVIGGGPLFDEITASAQNKNIEFLGRQTPERAVEYIRGARFVVVPSECYENFPRVVAEAYACGVPVIASDLGALAELVSNGRTGFLFKAKDHTMLAQRIKDLIENETKVKEMGQNARREYETKYTTEKNYEELLNIYNKAINSSMEKSSC